MVDPKRAAEYMRDPNPHAPSTLDEAHALLLDAQRYRKLRSIGAAPNGTRQLENSTVLVAQILDEWIDKTWPAGNGLVTNAILGRTPAPLAERTS